MIKNFLGYKLTTLQTTVNEFKNTSSYTLLKLNETIFFPTIAGQVCDLGFVVHNEQKYAILDLQLVDDEVIHKVELITDLVVGDSIVCELNIKHRNFVSANHTAAHLFYDTVIEDFPDSQGQGYFNNERTIRLDMSIKQKIDSKEVAKITKRVIDKIGKKAQKIELFTTKQIAQNEWGLSTDFNEKSLGDDVRIVRFGDISTQLCSGTHINNTSEIELFCIFSIEKKGNNIYRFYAATTKENLDKEVKLQQAEQHAELEILMNKYKTAKIKSSTVTKLLEECQLNLKEYKIILWKENLSKLKITVNDLLVEHDKKRRQQLINKYINVKFENKEDINYASINDDEISIKDAQQIADIILKNNPNSVIEFINLKDKTYLCKSNSIRSAIEIMQKKEFNVKGGGTPKVAQGKIIN
ncbi:alanyl-tRNA synthetase [Spiroplasma sp. TIUS-1]|uniref:hypothetical protein n=1 Tax=Spiroplasma sp. TIUS-1 TaxID=216963 RepID=UPI001399031F|nr:hypothetical protein [Spiroplasma sp. TIUS-1]QHX35741.1 alanyl-tRNA synthetase [Spiroplasma sp. TIUS-1]